MSSPPAVTDLGVRSDLEALSEWLDVAEPATDGSFSEVMQPFHDETEVRRAAEQALAVHARPYFAEERVCRYVTHTRFADFDAFVADILAPAYVRYRREQVASETVRQRFERCLAGADYLLEQPVRVNLYRAPRAG